MTYWAIAPFSHHHTIADHHSANGHLAALTGFIGQFKGISHPL
jgi:hypothetical protein